MLLYHQPHPDHHRCPLSTRQQSFTLHLVYDFPECFAVFEFIIYIIIIEFNLCIELSLAYLHSVMTYLQGNLIKVAPFSMS